ncbi:MAG: tRNA (adenine37-N(6))-methyltransferase TrmN6 (EC [uncultured Aureispira sp.]|uniref:tRNA1(Val) (adenine(37)-N6)-methyltransferase n=1 Tax=uncultured Aureispira sp. TaxID=1331704 RepID=A0A6S6SJ13_9BACT|nr:MAG: tRNA (adenine37-N(6))-methyltransferase TrmN6 (EC [uncultured Aureispira sp.]
MSTFRFKQFEIQQDKCAMKIGTDGVLLGAWANIAQASSILDIGTGTGVLALMSAQRNSNAFVHALEIDQNAFSQASDNLKNSPWQNRLTVAHQSIQQYIEHSPIGIFDSIISNPPYFKIETGTVIQNTARRQARSTDALTFTTLLDCVGKILHPLGNFSVILPTQEGTEFMQLAIEKKFIIKRCIKVIPREGKASNRFLIELVFYDTPIQEDTLIIRTIEKGNHHYTAEFKQLHKDFLLAF